jgi:hypothetical protein
MESLIFRVISHASPRESMVDSYPIFKSAGMNDKKDVKLTMIVALHQKPH